MNRWVAPGADDHAGYLSAAKRLIRPGTSLPASIVRDGVRVVGFEDETRVRQAPEYFQRFLQFLARVEESEFFFLWMDGEGPDAPMHEVFVCDTAPELSTDFIRLQYEGAGDLLYSDRWLIASTSAQWGIFGEHYNSEMALFLACTDSAAEHMRAAFPDVIADPDVAIDTFGDQGIKTETGERFKAEFLKAYRRQ